MLGSSSMHIARNCSYLYPSKPRLVVNIVLGCTSMVSHNMHSRDMRGIVERARIAEGNGFDAAMVSEQTMLGPTRPSMG